MHHGLFLHSPTEGCLGSLQILTLTKLLWTLGCRILCGQKFSSPLHKCRGKHSCWIVWFENASFWKKPPASSNWAVPVCIPTRTVTNESSASSPALAVVSGLDLDHLKGMSEKAMAPHSSTLAWKIPWTEEPGRLQSMGSLGVGHDWVTSLSLFTFMHWRRKWQPTLVFLPGESQGRGSLVGYRLWARTESDTTEVA